MVKPNFQLKVCSAIKVNGKPNSKAEAIVAIEAILAEMWDKWAPPDTIINAG